MLKTCFLLALTTCSLAAPRRKTRTKSLFPNAIDVSELDTTNGYTIRGIAANDESGWAVSNAGDFNGDGVDDFAITAYRAAGWAGETYIIFGSSSMSSAVFNLSNVDGVNGIVVTGVAANDKSGYSVAGVGDFNGDGVDDIAIGANFADPGGVSGAGSTYVVFGSRTLPANIQLGSLTGSDGVAFHGINVMDNSGQSVAGIGDFNNDGVNDIAIGAFQADPSLISGAGSTYVVFGSTDPFPATINLGDLDGTDGVAIHGFEEKTWSGHSVAGVGDMNGDNIPDLAIGAYAADPNAVTDAGATYIVFGSDSAFPASMSLGSLNGDNGFAINGIEAGDNSGKAVGRVGDFNGDGLQDVVIGAIKASPNGTSAAGSTYVVFGSSDGFSASFDLSNLNGMNGVAFHGIMSNDESGFAVNGAGDINRDGYDDVVISAHTADPNNIDAAGEVYIVFGSPAMSNTHMSLADLDGENGFVVRGVNTYDGIGQSVSGVGDINNDGVDDVAIGASLVNGNGELNVGETFVLFGVPQPTPTQTATATMSVSASATMPMSVSASAAITSSVSSTRASSPSQQPSTSETPGVSTETPSVAPTTSPRVVVTSESKRDSQDVLVPVVAAIVAAALVAIGVIGFNKYRTARNRRNLPRSSVAKWAREASGHSRM